MLHPFECWIILLEMVKSIPAPKIGSMSIRIHLPDWNLHARWWIKNFSTFKKLSQIADPCLMPMVPFLYQTLKYVSFRYLCWMILLHVLAPNKPLQRDFMRNAPLKQRRSMIPQPPIPFGRVMFDNLVKWYFFPFGLPPQMMFSMRQFRLLMMEAGIWERWAQ